MFNSVVRFTLICLHFFVVAALSIAGPATVTEPEISNNTYMLTVNLATESGVILGGDLVVNITSGEDSASKLRKTYSTH